MYNYMNAENVESLNMEDIMKRFLEKYKPGNNLVKPEQRFIDQAKKIVPNEIIELWTKYGFGEYGDGLIKIVNPEDYMVGLYDWLGKKDFTRIPIMVDAFGDIFYYRYLGEGENDISVVDVHYGTIKVCSNSYKTFFAFFMMNLEDNDIYLRRKLYNEAVNKYGKLKMDEVFYFAPAIKISGYEHINFIKKGDIFGSIMFLSKLNLNEISLFNKYKDNSSLMIINNVFPIENGLTPILGNVLKGTLNVGDKITVIRGDDMSFDGVIEQINVGKEVRETINEQEKIVVYLKDIKDNDIKNVSLINRSILIKK